MNIIERNPLREKLERRKDVMSTIALSMDEILESYLIPVETNWQPSDLLPDSSNPDFYKEVKEIQEVSKALDYDLWIALVGDTITEEALPTYESWLMGMDAVNQEEGTGWSRWVRAWTAEENRHGDLLNKYLYLSGRVNMREMEVSTQHLINDGFDIQTGSDPYKNFVYTSFQELATNVSHRRTGTLARKAGSTQLGKICGMIAADEARHAKAYKNFVSRIFELDASEMMLAFEHMMRKKIVMPAHFLRETGTPKGGIWDHFSDAAQRIKVYTSQDYVDILRSLIAEWEIEKRQDLNEAAEKARDYVMALPDRLARLADRIKIPERPYQFKWVTP